MPDEIQPIASEAPPDVQIQADDSFPSSNFVGEGVDIFPSTQIRRLPQGEGVPGRTFTLDVAKAALLLDNEPASFARFVTSRAMANSFEEEPGFSVTFEDIEDTPLEDKPEKAASARSRAELNYLIGFEQEEIDSRRLLEMSGGKGIFFSVIAGVMSPLSLISFGAGALQVSLLRGIGAGAVAGVGGALSSEAILQATQSYRPWVESGFATGAGLFLGSALGGLGGVLGRRAFQRSARLTNLILGDGPFGAVKTPILHEDGVYYALTDEGKEVLRQRGIAAFQAEKRDLTEQEISDVYHEFGEKIDDGEAITGITADDKQLVISNTLARVADQAKVRPPTPPESAMPSPRPIRNAINAEDYEKARAEERARPIDESDDLTMQEAALLSYVRGINHPEARAIEVELMTRRGATRELRELLSGSRLIRHFGFRVLEPVHAMTEQQFIRTFRPIIAGASSAQVKVEEFIIAGGQSWESFKLRRGLEDVDFPAYLESIGLTDFEIAQMEILQRLEDLNSEEVRERIGQLAASSDNTPGHILGPGIDEDIVTAFAKEAYARIQSMFRLDGTEWELPGAKVVRGGLLEDEQIRRLFLAGVLEHPEIVAARELSAAIGEFPDHELALLAERTLAARKNQALNQVLDAVRRGDDAVTAWDELVNDIEIALEAEPGTLSPDQIPVTFEEVVELVDTMADQDPLNQFFHGTAASDLAGGRFDLGYVGAGVSDAWEGGGIYGAQLIRTGRWYRMFLTSRVFGAEGLLIQGKHSVLPNEFHNLDAVYTQQSELVQEAIADSIRNFLSEEGLAAAAERNLFHPQLLVDELGLPFWSGGAPEKHQRANHLDFFRDNFQFIHNLSGEERVAAIEQFIEWLKLGDKLNVGDLSIAANRHPGIFGDEAWQTFSEDFFPPSAGDVTGRGILRILESLAPIDRTRFDKFLAETVAHNDIIRKRFQDATNGVLGDSDPAFLIQNLPRFTELTEREQLRILTSLRASLTQVFPIDEVRIMMNKANERATHTIGLGVPLALRTEIRSVVSGLWDDVQQTIAVQGPEMVGGLLLAKSRWEKANKFLEVYEDIVTELSPVRLTTERWDEISYPRFLEASAGMLRGGVKANRYLNHGARIQLMDTDGSGRTLAGSPAAFNESLGRNFVFFDDKVTEVVTINGRRVKDGLDLEESIRQFNAHNVKTLDQYPLGLNIRQAARARHLMQTIDESHAGLGRFVRESVDDIGDLPPELATSLDEPVPGDLARFVEQEAQSVERIYDFASRAESISHEASDLADAQKVAAIRANDEEVAGVRIEESAPIKVEEPPKKPRSIGELHGVGASTIEKLKAVGIEDTQSLLAALREGRTGIPGFPAGGRKALKLLDAEEVRDQAENFLISQQGAGGGDDLPPIGGGGGDAVDDFSDFEGIDPESEFGEMVASVFGLENFRILAYSPEARILFRSPSSVAKRILQKLTPTNYKLAKHYQGEGATSAVETEIKGWQLRVQFVMEEIRQLQNKYYLGRAIDDERAVSNTAVKATRLAHRDVDERFVTLDPQAYREAVTRALRRGSRADDVPADAAPYIEESARLIRERLWLPVSKDLEGLGKAGGVDPMLYVFRVYNIGKIRGDMEGFQRAMLDDLLDQGVPEAEARHVIPLWIEGILSTPGSRAAPNLSDVDFAGGNIGRAGRTRVVEVRDEALEDWLENDITNVMNAYLHTRIPDLELSKAFGDIHMTDAIAGLHAERDELMRGAPEARPPGVSRKQGGMTKGEILDELAQNERDLLAIRDILRHTLEVPLDPYSIPGRAQRMGRAMRDINYLRIGGGFGIVALSDLGGMVMVNGIRRTMGGLFKEMSVGIQNSGLQDMGRKDLRDLFIDFVDTFALRGQNILDLGDPGGSHVPIDTGLQKTEAFLHQKAKNFAFITLLTPWTNFAKRVAARGVTRRIVEVSEKISLGTASQDEIGMLARGGISSNDAVSIYNQWKIHGGQREGSYWMGVGAWGNEEGGDIVAAEVLRKKFRNTLIEDVDRAVVTPGAADSPIFLHRNTGKILFQFRRFGIAHSQKLLAPALQGLQRGDLSLLNGLAIGAAMGSMVYILKELSNKREMPTDVSRIIQEGVVRADLWGAIGEVDGLVAATTNRGLRQSLGPQTYYGYKTRDGFFEKMADVVLGPSVSTGVETFQSAVGLGKLAGGGLSRVDDRHIRAWRKILLYQNLFYLDWLMDSYENGVKNSANVQRRRRLIGQQISGATN